MTLFVNNAVIVNSFPLLSFSMYVWTSATLGRVLNELRDPTVGCSWTALACTLSHDPCSSHVCTRHKLFRCNCPSGFNKINSFNNLGPSVQWPLPESAGLSAQRNFDTRFTCDQD